MSKNITIFGDSIAWGVWDPQYGGWATRLRAHFESKDEDVRFYNCGICGDTTTGLLKRFEIESSARKSDAIIFAIGVNDSRRDDEKGGYETQIDQFAANYRQLLALAKKQARAVICVGLVKVEESKTQPCPWRETIFYSNEDVRLFDAKIRDICLEAGVPFIEMYDQLSDEDLDDGLHPNAQGHAKMFERIKGCLLENNIL